MENLNNEHRRSGGNNVRRHNLGIAAGRPDVVGRSPAPRFAFETNYSINRTHNHDLNPSASHVVFYTFDISKLLAAEPASMYYDLFDLANDYCSKANQQWMSKYTYYRWAQLSITFEPITNPITNTGVLTVSYLMDPERVSETTDEVRQAERETFRLYDPQQWDINVRRNWFYTCRRTDDPQPRFNSPGVLMLQTRSKMAKDEVMVATISGRLEFANLTTVIPDREFHYRMFAISTISDWKLELNETGTQFNLGFTFTDSSSLKDGDNTLTFQNSHLLELKYKEKDTEYTYRTALRFIGLFKETSTCRVELPRFIRYLNDQPTFVSAEFVPPITGVLGTLTSNPKQA